MTDPKSLSTDSRMTFVPAADNTRDLRTSLGRFATGVTLITAMAEDGPIGMTVNSFSSISLDPPLIAWSLAKLSGRYTPFANARYFSVNVLCNTQANIALEFARDATGFDDTLWDDGELEMPILKDALACFECSREFLYEGGDHTIIIGRVEYATVGKGEPLLFYGGAFGKFRQVS